MDGLAEVPDPGAEATDEIRPQAPIWAEPRHLFYFRLGTLLGDGGQKPVEILALAESGAIVRTGAALEEGASLVIELNSHHRFAVRVEWSSDTLAGLEFEDREHVRATLAARDRAHPYRAPRLELAPRSSFDSARPASPLGRGTFPKAGSRSSSPRPGMSAARRA